MSWFFWNGLTKHTRQEILFRNVGPERLTSDQYVSESWSPHSQFPGLVRKVQVLALGLYVRCCLRLLAVPYSVLSSAAFSFLLAVLTSVVFFFCRARLWGVSECFQNTQVFRWPHRAGVQDHKCAGHRGRHPLLSFLVLPAALAQWWCGGRGAPGHYGCRLDSAAWGQEQREDSKWGNNLLQKGFWHLQFTDPVDFRKWQRGLFLCRLCVEPAPQQQLDKEQRCDFCFCPHFLGYTR